jgi:hypothetical protein
MKKILYRNTTAVARQKTPPIESVERNEGGKFDVNSAIPHRPERTFTLTKFAIDSFAQRRQKKH